MRHVQRDLKYFKERATVDPQTGCWLWNLSIRHGGYGKTNSIDGRTQTAHRAAWVAARGPISDGACVLHRCDVRLCCNPDHLFLGTNAENSRDMVSKDRQTKGARNGRARLAEHDVGIIKTLLGLGVKNHRLATLYGVSKYIISLVKRGNTWRHVEAVLS